MPWSSRQLQTASRLATCWKSWLEDANRFTSSGKSEEVPKLDSFLCTTAPWDPVHIRQKGGPGGVESVPKSLPDPETRVNWTIRILQPLSDVVYLLESKQKPSFHPWIQGSAIYWEVKLRWITIGWRWLNFPKQWKRLLSLCLWHVMLEPLKSPHNLFKAFFHRLGSLQLHHASHLFLVFHCWLPPPFGPVCSPDPVCKEAGHLLSPANSFHYHINNINANVTSG